MIEYEEILKARKRIEDFILNTPIEFSTTFSKSNTQIYMKLECQQRLKAFKTRGAFSKLTYLTEEEKQKGVMAISSGNHGAAVSYAANILGIKKSKIYVPATTPKSKLDKIKYYGSEVVLAGDNYDAAHRIGIEALASENMVFVDSCSDPQVIAGQGTIGLEIMEENPDIDTILVPIGGGGLITGISIAAKRKNPNIKIIGVQPKACPAMVKAIEDNYFYEEYPTEESMCDALVGGVAYIPFKMAKQCIDDILLVDESTIMEALELLMTEEKVIAEPSGAVGLAAILENYDYFKGKKVVVIISGGNLDKRLMEEVIHSRQLNGELRR